MKYKVGDKVRIKSLDWYEKNKDEYGYIDYGSYLFFPCMSKFCGKTFEIAEVYSNCYHVKELYAKTLDWTDEMIDCLVEEESKFGTASNPVEPKSNANCLTMERVDAIDTKIDKELPSGNQNVWELPDGYQFTDDNGNVINATKIFLEKKKKEYPKTYEECLSVLQIKGYDIVTYVPSWTSYEKTLCQKVLKLRELIICRDAYWKLYGEEMGLGKPWEPDWKNHNIKYILYNQEGEIDSINVSGSRNSILAFPAAEMRDAFYENFKKEIEICKELF